MGFTYNIRKKYNDKYTGKCLLICHMLYNVTNLFLTTFLVAHIYSLSADLYKYVFNVALFELVSYLTMMILYFAFCYIVDKTNRVWIYRFSIFIEAIFVIVCVFYGEELGKIIGLVGFLKGLCHAGYFASYNVLRQEMVSKSKINNFMVISSVASKIINVVCPIVLGILIDISTYSMVAIYILAICVIQIIVTFFIKSEKPTNSHFSMKEFLQELRKNDVARKKIKPIYIACIFFAFTSISTSLLNIYTMMHFKSNFSLGYLTSIFAVISAIIIILNNKYSSSPRHSWIYLILAILLICSTVIFASLPTIATLIIYNLFFAISETLISVNIAILRNKHLKEQGLYNYIAEHQCLIESIFQTVRILSYLVLMVASFVGNSILIQILFACFASLFAVTLLKLAKYENSQK